MYHRVVVGTDGSSAADRAVRVACELVVPTTGSLHVVSAYKPARLAALAGGCGVTARYGEDERLAAKLVLDDAISFLPRESTPVSTIFRLGDAGDVILAVAEEVDADLIVIGNRGSGGVRRYRLGGVADRIAHDAPCSVHIVHER